MPYLIFFHWSDRILIRPMVEDQAPISFSGRLFLKPWGLIKNETLKIFACLSRFSSVSVFEKIHQLT